MVDGSFRITRSDPVNWGRVLGFLLLLLEKFDLGSDRTRVAAIVYGDEGQVVFYLNTYNGKVCTVSYNANKSVKAFGH